MPIPKILHLIWFGKMSQKIYNTIHTISESNKDISIFIWVYDTEYVKKYTFYKSNIYIKCVICEKTYMRDRVLFWLKQKKWKKLRYAAASDCWRFYVLMKYGGIYSDINNNLGSIPKNFFKNDIWLLHNKKSKDVFPSLMGAKKNHILYKKAVSLFIRLQFTNSHIKKIRGDKNKWKFICQTVNFILYTIFIKDNQYIGNIHITDVYKIYHKNKCTKCNIGSGLSSKIGSIENIKKDYIDIIHKLSTKPLQTH